MPAHFLSLPDIDQTVARPAIFSIINQLSEITKLPKDTQINFKGDAAAVLTPGTSIDDSSRDAKFAARHYTFVDVVETPQLGAMQEVFMFAKENPLIFYDQELGVELRPVYTTSDVTIQLRFRSPSETEVKRWMAEMYLNTSRGRDINLHTLNYTFPIPYGFLGLLEDIWTLREAHVGYNESFEKYFTDHATQKLTILANQAGGMRHLAVRDTQTRIQGMFDFAGVPDAPVKDNATGTWEIAFSYKFSYQRPDAIFVEFPLTVHQELLPSKWYSGLRIEDDPELRQIYYTRSYTALSRFEGNRMAEGIRDIVPYIRIPDFDDFSCRLFPPWTSTVLTSLSFIEEDGKTLLDLKELGDYILDEDVVQFMKSEASHMNKLFHSLFYVSIYEGDRKLPDEKVLVSSQLVVSCKEPLNPRKVYRVRLSMLTNIQSGQWAAIERLGAYPKAFTKVLASLNELLAKNPDFVKLQRNRTIESWEMTYAYWVLSGGNNPVGSKGNSVVWNDIVTSPGNSGREGQQFFGSIPPAVLKEYFAVKRRSMPTVQTSYIVTSAIKRTS